MKQQSTFTDWDFSNVWKIDDTTTYPYLKNNIYTNYSLIELPKYYCNGTIDPNAILVSSDENVDVPITEQTSILVDISTNRKCEWVCKEGFEKVGNSCQIINLIEQYSCTGIIDEHAIVFENDDVDLDSNTTRVLVDMNSNTSRKCEYYCPINFIKQENVCVFDENYGDGNYKLDDYAGTNSIIRLDASYVDGNVLINVNCFRNVDTNITIFSNDFEYTTTLSCTRNQLDQSFYLDLNANKTYTVSASISSPCETCQKTTYLIPKEKVNTIIPDNNLITAVVILLTIIVFSFKKNKK